MLRAPNPHARPWRREAARHQATQIILVSLAHDPRRTHCSARRATHDGVGTLEMVARALNDRRAGPAERGMRQDLARLARRDPGLVECFTRQIQAADLRVLVEVANQMKAARPSSRAEAQIGQHERQALELLRRAVLLQPAAGRAEFWRKLETDPVLRSLRGNREFVRLRAEFAGKPG